MNLLDRSGFITSKPNESDDLDLVFGFSHPISGTEKSVHKLNPNPHHQLKSAIKFYLSNNNKL
jgi:hypothetical protein